MKLQSLASIGANMACTDVEQDNEAPPNVRKKVLTALRRVEKCVNGYSERHGLGGKVEGVLYRVWNAVKAIFGMSDWQRARNGIISCKEPVIKDWSSKEASEGERFFLRVWKVADGQLFSKRSCKSARNCFLDAALHGFIAVNENKLLTQFANAMFNDKLKSMEKVELIGKAGQKFKELLTEEDSDEIMSLGVNIVERGKQFFGGDDDDSAPSIPFFGGRGRQQEDAPRVVELDGDGGTPQGFGGMPQEDDDDAVPECAQQ